jgi:heparan-alpha-glucosaminide N-acetyltransferase
MQKSIVCDPSQRLVSLDAFRGFTMLLMASGAFGLSQVATQFPNSAAWHFIGEQFSHAPWRGGGLWDMIQPAFTFMVGVSMTYSYARRRELGQSSRHMLAHAAYRAVVLVMLGVLLRTRWTFEDVLSQIGLGYLFLFLLWSRPTKVILSATVAILLGYWALFASWPLPPAGYDYNAVGVSAGWATEHDFTGFAAHWNKNANPAHYFDVWFLNLFPQRQAFTHNGGGYQTLSFIPSLATMLIGLLAGGLLRSERSSKTKVTRLVAYGAAALLAGLLLDATGICPIVKRIWTPAWTLYSAGWVIFTLAAFYSVVDVYRYRAWAWIGVVVGLNSIAMYVMSGLVKGWVGRALHGVFGEEVFTLFDRVVETVGENGTIVEHTITYEPVVSRVVVLAVLWFFCWRLYRNRIFFRI